MAGYGLTQAVQQYQRGLEWRKNEDAMAKQQEQQAKLEEANKAAAGVLERSKAEWALNGAQGEYRPNDQTMFSAAEARGQALAKAGMWNEFLQNEAAVQGQRVRVRQSALQKYQMDGDVEALARSVYPTVFDGKSIVGMEKIEGAESVQGLPALPAKLKFKLSDGSTQTVEPQQLVSSIKQTLIDPKMAAEQEIKTNFERLKHEFDLKKTDAETAGKLKVEEKKGDVDKAVEGLKHDNARALLGEKQKFEGSQKAADRASEEKRTSMSTAATRYSADRGLEGAKVRADGETKAPKRLNTKELTDLAIRQFGEITDDGYGKSRLGNETTAAIVQGAQKYLRSYPDASESEALNKAAEILGLPTAKAK